MHAVANTIPEDITYSILRYAIDSKLLYIKSWRLQLRLLAICSQWRALLVPNVYSHMLVCYEAYSVSAAHIHGSQTADSTQLVSNTSLFAGYPNLIRRVKHTHIYTNDNCQKLEWLNRATSELALLQPQWLLASRPTLHTKCLCCIDITAQGIAKQTPRISRYAGNPSAEFAVAHSNKLSNPLLSKVLLTSTHSA
ncbi:hypothetical protein BX667DRAFT_506345 [Coemansia mojavensis]|nr:hypothetical protein BX667DRAFT_506345 [Coemansia mojavensis]